MKKHHFSIHVPGIVAVSAFALALGAGAQMSPAPPAGHPAGHDHPMDMNSAAGAKSEKDMKAECQAMMDKKREMLDQHRAMDAKLDKLVAAMNAAKSSKQRDAMEGPMAAVISELVAQRKAANAMMMDMQPEMMAHMMRHMDMHGNEGAMDCPMMKMGMGHPNKDEEKKH